MHIAFEDTIGYYAFTFLPTNKIQEAAGAVFHSDVLPQYTDWSIKVQTALTIEVGSSAEKIVIRMNCIAL